MLEIHEPAHSLHEEEAAEEKKDARRITLTKGPTKGAGPTGAWVVQGI